MAIQLLTQIQALIHLAAGRLDTARTTVESLPEQERMPWTRIGGRIGLMTLARVAAHTNDRALLREVAIHARDAYAAEAPPTDGRAWRLLRMRHGSAVTPRKLQRWLTDDVHARTDPVVGRGPRSPRARRPGRGRDR